MRSSVRWDLVQSRLSTPKNLRSELYDTPLSIHLKALLMLLEGDMSHSIQGLAVPISRNRRSPVDVLLDHEYRYWEEHAACLKLNLDLSILQNIVAAVTLFGADSQEEALAILSAVPGLGSLVQQNSSAGFLRSVDEKTLVLADRFARELFGSGIDASSSRLESYWDSLQPDYIGEWHVGRCAERNSQLISLLARGATDHQRDRAMEVLDRATSHQRHLSAALEMLRTSKSTGHRVLRMPAPTSTQLPSWKMQGQQAASTRESYDPAELMRVDRPDWTEKFT
ncbi:MAG: hypothetical protein ACRD2L_03255 [Terriglobia bacterium]